MPLADRTIKRVVVRRFANHEDSAADFRPGVNWIVGKNDSGKSQFFNAMATVLRNDAIASADRSRYPDGKELPGAMEISITFSDGLFLSRTSGKKENTLTVAEPRGNPETFAKPLDATERVRELAGIVESPNEARLFPQIQVLGDPLFIVNRKTPVAACQILGGLLFPSVLPAAKKRAVAALKQADARLNRAREALHQFEADPGRSPEQLMKKINDAKDVYRDITYLKSCKESTSEVVGRICDLSPMREKYAELQGRLQKLARAVQTAEDIRRYSEAIKALNRLTDWILLAKRPPVNNLNAPFDAVLNIIRAIDESEERKQDLEETRVRLQEFTATSGVRTCENCGSLYVQQGVQNNG